jgi:hypothetical protein
VQALAAAAVDETGAKSHCCFMLMLTRSALLTECFCEQTQVLMAARDADEADDKHSCWLLPKMRI